MGKPILILGLILAFSSNAFADATQKEAAAKKDLKKPIICATAEGDIRALKSEKLNALQQLAAGVTSIVPIGAVVHIAKGTEGEKLEIATGHYNDLLEKKIAEIQAQCNVQ